jgi:hypothetical protein
MTFVRSCTQLGQGPYEICKALYTTWPRPYEIYKVLYTTWPGTLFNMYLVLYNLASTKWTR